ncbi:VWA domain-containing protein [bacterium]|nr:MAG: VWA domain-containing protein [bacterium]
MDATEPPSADREGYDRLVENPYQSPVDQPLSTFSIDVDKASYANARRFLQSNRLPPPDAVRIEEFINYFSYTYPEPTGEHPLSITTELAAAPWNDAHKLVRIGLKARTVPKASYPPSNLVFLVDTSGSMASDDKLPLLQKSLSLLVEELRDTDHVAIVAYAGAAGLVLPSTSGRDKRAILDALNRLQSGGSTAGGAGIQLAYKTALDNFIKKGNNRVILATDGDFNVGLSSDGELTRLIEEEREKGVFLTVLGFGTGNYQDAKMEKLADKGNGNYAYVDSLNEGRKVLVEEMGGTLLTLAKDVKLQVEFNPARVKAYRLIGYENRMLKAEDFNDDKKDAGELGSGQTVTALYEVIPPGVDVPGSSVDPLKYQKTANVSAAAGGSELLTVKFRYKDPEGTKSKLQTAVLEDSARPWGKASADFRTAAAAAGFGMVLRHSEFAGSLDYAKVVELARPGAESDAGGSRAEMLGLVEKARLLDSPSLRLKER